MDNAHPPEDRIALLSREFAYTCDRGGTITWIDVRAERVLDMRVGQNVSSLVWPGEEDKFTRFLPAALAGPTEAWELAQLVHGLPCTVTVWAEPYDEGALVVGNVLADSYGVLQAAVAGIASELATLQREAERKRRELDAARAIQQKLLVREREAHAVAQAARERVTQILESISDAFIAVDGEGLLTYVNGPSQDLFGGKQVDLIGGPLADLLPSMLGGVLLEVSKLVRHQGRPVQREVQVRDNAWVELRAHVAEGTVSIFLTDISARKEQEERVRYAALHDPLTGLVNRRAFDDALERLANRARHGQPGALLMLDLDRFKRINDAAGHPAGDEALRRVAELMRLQLRPHDILARLGGDEFAVLLAETTYEIASTLAERLVHAVMSFQFDWEGQAFDLGLSVGVAPIDGEAADVVVARADAALYQAKVAGRGRVIISANNVAPES